MTGRHRSTHQGNALVPVASTIRHAALAALASSLVASSCAHAATLHVTNGSGDCTSPAQGCELATAIAITQSGDTVRVHAGPPHPVTAPVGPGAGPITIESVPGQSRPVLSVSAAGELRLGAGSELSGVDLVSTADHAVTAVGAQLDRVRVTAYGSSAVGVRLRDGAVLRNSTVSTSGAGSSGVLVDAGGRPNRLVGTSAIASGPSATALLCAPGGVADSSTVRAVNTILRGYDGARDVRSVASVQQTATVVLDHSATDPATHEAVGPGAAIDDRRGTVTGAPEFLDRANLDLRQRATSPTIDAGTADIDGDGDVDLADAGAAGTLDLDGTPRQLGAPDIGADEREMPPLVLTSEPLVKDGAVSLRIVVQPRGLETMVSAEWTTADGITASASAPATGNEPVTIELPLGALPTGTQVTLRAKASNSAGSVVSGDATVDVPVPAVVPPDPSTSTVRVTPATPSGAPPTAPSSALPKLVRTTVRRHWGIVDARLRCGGPAACSGTVLLTRLGPARRWSTFTIAPGATKSIPLTLTVAQTRKLRKAGKRGVRVLLEVRSPSGQRAFNAVRLNHSR